MKRDKLQLLISFAEANDMMDWPLSAVLTEYTLQDCSEEAVEAYDEMTGEQIK